jgi:hypothetical protein
VPRIANDEQVLGPKISRITGTLTKAIGTVINMKERSATAKRALTSQYKVE